MIFVSLVAIVGGGVVGMRTGRGKVAQTLEIKPGIYGVKTAGGIYVYAARAGQNLILFDSGSDPQARPIDKLLGALAGSRPDVRDIFLTHGHFDHISGALSFAGSGVRTYLGAADVELAAGTVAPEAIGTKALTLVMRPEPLKVTDLLTGPATIPVGEGKTVKALPVPGHTPGSYAFLFEGVLFSGDIMIIKEGRLETTPALFDAHPEENRAAIRSLKTQLVADTVETVCTSHGGCTPKGLGRNLLDDLIARVGG
jgi:glyoxylase-like metal-dependent hydrolase (beta-lactamase superfamily II)